MFNIYEIVNKMLNEHEKAMLKIIYSKNGSGTREILNLFGSHTLGYKALRGLEEKGLITRVNGKKRTNVFLTNYGRMVYQILYTDGGKLHENQSLKREKPSEAEVSRVTTDNERYVTGDEFFKCYEWCESQGKHKDEFDKCVKECLRINPV